MIAFIFLLFLHPSKAGADRALSEREILARCYAKLTGQRLSPTDPLWAQLATFKSGASVCTKLLNEVQLGADGQLTQASNPTHRRILKQLNDLHRDWFPQRWSYNNNLPDVYYGTVDLFDASEPAMFITQSLLSQQFIHYQNVLRGRKSLVAVRDGSAVNPQGRGSTGILRPSRAYVGDLDSSQQVPAGVFNSPQITVQSPANAFTSVPSSLVQVGDLVGIRSLDADTSLPFVWTYSQTVRAVANTNGIVNPQNLHQNYGGGALGSQPFLLLNFGQDFSYSSNGTSKLPRRVMMAAFNSFLCLNGPFSRPSDVSSFLVPSSVASAAAFRKTASCLRCHATIDNAALTLRNLQLGSTANGIPAGVARIPAFVASAAASTPASQWPAEPSSSFNQTLPQGRVFFRSVNGSLVNQDVQNLDELGAVLSSTDDYYTCAASRYFKYFTGISVPLFDPMDPSNQGLIESQTGIDREFRDYVFGLGKELKATGSLKGLMNKIITSPYYKLSNYGR